MLTTREYCHNVTAVDPMWLVEVAPQFFEVTDTNKISKHKNSKDKREKKVESLCNNTRDNEWRLSKIKRSARSVCFLFSLMKLDTHSLLYRVKHLVKCIASVVSVFCFQYICI